ncbi:MAG: FecR domain-containing protein, partial [Chthoniobacterales bacterium]|nr:FecR domain-containing protein [Chthoniobacterales bacterium]
MKRNLTLAALSIIVAVSAKAGPLTEARINKIINEVTIVDSAATVRPAKLNEVLKNQVGVKTGVKSRSELLFQDETLTRIGPETYFSFTPGTRELDLRQGTLLLQVPKGLGGAKIRTAAVTAA